MQPSEQIQKTLERVHNQATLDLIAEEQPPFEKGYKPDARSFFRLPARACYMVRGKNDWRVLSAICLTSSIAGICYASQEYLASLAGISYQPTVSKAVKNLHNQKLIRLLLPKGKAYPGRFQRSNRIQVLFEENAPLPSEKELMLEYGHRTRRWR